MSQPVAPKATYSEVHRHNGATAPEGKSTR